MSSPSPADGGDGDGDGRKRKRRRNHQAAGSFPVAVPLVLGSAAPSRPAAADGTSAAPPQVDALLVNLAEACRKHQKGHQSSSKSSKRSISKAGDGSQQQHCQSSLESLRVILPKLEETYKASRQPSLENLKHICDFYGNVCRGGFCPQAPELFDRGRRQGAQVMPRVFALMEHLIAKNVVANQVVVNITSPLLSPPIPSTTAPAPAITLNGSLHETLVHTIVTLLLLLPEASLHRIILQNLVQLLVDATTVLMVCTQADYFAPVQLDVTLLPAKPLMTAAVLTSMSTTAERPTSISAPAAAATPFRLTIRSLDQARAWQSGLFYIISLYLRRLRQNRVTSLHHHLNLVISQDEPGVFVDELLLPPSIVNSCLRTSKWTTAACNQACDNKGRVLVLHSKFRSLQLLLTIINLQDSAHSNPRLQCQAAIIVAKATRDYFRLSTQPPHADNGSLAVAAILERLLIKTILLLPNAVVDAATAELQSTRLIQTTVWPILIDAMTIAACRCLDAAVHGHEAASRRIQVNDQGQLLASDDEEHVRLMHVCLAILYQGVLVEPSLVRRLVGGSDSTSLPSQSQSMPTTIHNTTNPFALKLLDWLSNPRLAHLACGIMAAWLEKTHLGATEKMVKVVLASSTTRDISNNENDTAMSLANNDKQKEALDEASPAKRQKSGTSSEPITKSYLVSYEHRIANFLVATARPAATRLCAVTLGSMSSDCITDVMTIASAIRLLVPLIDLDERQNDPCGLSALLALILESMIAFCILLGACASSCATCVSTCIDCGVYVMASDSRHPLIDVFVKQARILCLKVASMASSGEKAALMVCPFSVESSTAISLANGLSAVRIDLFQGISLAMRWNKNSAAFSYALVVDFLFGPISDDASLQHERLAYLEIQSGRPELSGGELSLLSLLQQTLAWVTHTGSNAEEDPLVRLIWWRSVAWLLLCVNPVDLHRNCPSLADRRALLIGLLTIAMADAHPCVRDFTGREIGMTLLAGGDTKLSAFLLANIEIQDMSVCGVKRAGSIEQVAAALFEEVDSLLYEHASVPQALLSYTVRNSKPKRHHMGFTRSPREVLAFQRSALRTLVSVSITTGNLSNELAMSLLDNAFKRAISVSVGDSSSESLQTRGICLGELAVARALSELPILFQPRVDDIVPEILYNLLVPCSGFEIEPSRRSIAIESIPTSRREQRHRMLCTIIQRFVMTKAPTDMTIFSQSISDTFKFIDLILPSVMSQFVSEKEYDALRLATELKIYIMHMNRHELKIRTRSSLYDMRPGGEIPADVVVGKISTRKAIRKIWVADLEDETRRLCLSPNFTERILATIFIKGGQSELLFFLKVVLQDKLTLPIIMGQREQVVFRELMWELGRPQMSDVAAKAIRLTALAKRQDFLSQIVSLSDESSLSSSYSASEVADFVSSHFMYLLVNVVQNRWSSKTTNERKQSLRCLSKMLNFLRHTDALQYVPQIMSTVNAAISDDGDGQADAGELTCRAIDVLSQFVKLIAREHSETLGQNLVAIVVSIIPVLTIPEAKTSCNEKSFVDNARDAAVSLLEWLTQGELGRNLAKRFKEIPFLPVSEVLDGVRSNLQLVGVDFDALNSSTVDGRPNKMLHFNSMASDGSTSAERMIDVTRKQEALRHRLDIIRPLLKSENLSIRTVSLQHVTALLQANRELFHLLIDNEGTASMEQYLTVAYDGCGRSRGVVVDLIETLLVRCAEEIDTDARLQLAVCLGEVGAIDMNRLDATHRSASQGESASFVADKRALPPWKSSAAHYEFRLVTTDLVFGLKAASTTTDQNKIAYTIQQLLILLDSQSMATENEAAAAGGVSQKEQKRSEKKMMSKQLSTKLKSSGVFDIVEPFWHTEYCEGSEKFATKSPPFFRSSKTYANWMANWCRFMIANAKDGKRTAWIDLFIACKIVMRSQAGLNVAETLLPVLVLDRLCFGKSKDEREIIDELTSVLNFDTFSQMDISERQKSVNTVFSLIATLEQWFEDETELKHKPKGRESSKHKDACDDEWPRDSTLIRIEDLLKALPLSLRARAAARVGMHAGALRILEIAARKSCASVVFDSSQNKDQVAINRRSRAAGVCPSRDLNLMKDVLAELYDYDTMASLVNDHVCLDPELRLRDSMRLKEATGDWEGALQDYEHAQHIRGPDHVLRLGSLRCLLELGHFESVLNQVNGLVRIPTKEPGQNLSPTTTETETAFPFAIEAAWRLGRWDKLDELVECMPADACRKPESRFQVSLGSIMLEIRHKNPRRVQMELKGARSALMLGLSNLARESYSRAYTHVVDLQCLREIEDCVQLLCSSEQLELESHSAEWNWPRRLNVLSSTAASVAIKSRLAVSRLANDKAMEGSLFLDLGKRARKSSLWSIAASSFAQAETALASLTAKRPVALERYALQIQMAKLRYDCGESGAALRLLQLEDEEKLAGAPLPTVQHAVARYVTTLLGACEGSSLTEVEMIDIYSRSLLRTTRWMIDGGLKDSSQIKDRFTLLHRLAPNWEKGHFHYAKFVDSLLESRIDAIRRRSPDKFVGLDEEKVRCRCLVEDKACHRNTLLTIQHYIESLKLDTKHVYQALPRLLSLWFEFTALSMTDDESKVAMLPSTVKRAQAAPLSADFRALLMAQEETNALIAREYKSILPRAFYTAIPQLVSRVSHDSKDTEKLVRVILTRVLMKHPEQTMWLLGWLRQSQLQERRVIGLDLFKQAEQTLLKLGGAQNAHRHKLLVESESLFTYFHNLAVHKISEMSTHKMTIKSWRGAVALADFVPPIQAALSVSLLSTSSGVYRESFPRQVPRIRCISPELIIMGSKARPKKLKVFVVSAETQRSSIALSDKPGPQSDDIGEIHFLVKQEARGDLRKDARVQDLNTVINRLMASSTVGKAISVSRRNRLRTYAVTCLSEDTGILEWVPDTAPLRALITAAYNPQASPFSAKRRGQRAAAFGDPMLRANFEKKCQPLFFEHGDLRRAATLFDELCLKPFPPLLYWWFVQHFPDPHAWYEARMRFTLSAAVWSGVGHVIGLGDRHSENILVDMTSGEVVHVDFDCIFDKGLSLPKPEAVPFRLTHNMVDAFGPTGVDGVFTRSLNSTMCILRSNHDTLLSVLEPFIKDPIIDWRRLRSQQKTKDRQSGKAAAADTRQSQEAKRSLLVIDQRLKGIYNLRNPNLLRIRMSDLRGTTLDQDDDLTHLVPLSVDGQVQKMISEARSSENLVQLYIGWMPWL